MKKIISSIALASVFSVFVSCGSERQGGQENTETETTEEMPKDRISLVRDDANRKVDVLIDGELFTAYRYPENIMKPVLYPLTTPQGTLITRKFPMEKGEGERVDHPHHAGVWFNYGDVNGLDFWNNSEAIPEEKKDKYGTIYHREIIGMSDGDDIATLQTGMDWTAPDGKVLLKENTQFVFGVTEEYRFIDRYTTLVAQDEAVSFDDNKEGVLGIRVTRALEHPSDKPEVFTDANGISTGVPVINNDGVNGNYISSNGVEGTDTWGKRADWINLTSSIGDEKISLVILDHPKNVGYPTYWHARGYGLFAANPLGQKVFSDGKEELNFKLEPGEEVTFRHRIIIASDMLDKTKLDAEFQNFASVKM